MTFDIHALAKSICIDPIVEAQRIATDCDGEPRVERLTEGWQACACGKQVFRSAAGNLYETSGERHACPNRPAMVYVSAEEKPHSIAALQFLGPRRKCAGYWVRADYGTLPHCVVLDFADGQQPDTACLSHGTLCDAARAVASTYSNPRGTAQGA